MLFCTGNLIPDQYPSIQFFTTAYPALHWLKPVPALIGQRWGTPLDKSPIYHGDDRDKQVIALTLTTTDNLESLIH